MVKDHMLEQADRYIDELSNIKTPGDLYEARVLYTILKRAAKETREHGTPKDMKVLFKTLKKARKFLYRRREF